LLAALAAAVALGLGLGFAGSPDKLAKGTRIAGVEVGGLRAADAERLLRRRSDRLRRVPVTFVAGAHRFALTPQALGVQVDWHAAVEAAQRQGGGLGVFRGYRRLQIKFFPEDVNPSSRVYDAALAYEVGRFGKAIDTRHKEARLVRRGLHVTIAAGSTGHVLDRRAARQLIVRSLVSFSRAPVGLPVLTDPPSVTVASLTAAQRTASRIVSAPVTLIAGPTRLRLARWRLAKMLDLTTLRLSGPAADDYFATLEKTVDRASRDAGFAVDSHGQIRVVPGKAGVVLDVPRSAARVLAAASRPIARTAQLVIATPAPLRSTDEARAMGITGTVGSFGTIYGGDPNRIHNVQLVARLIDGKVIAPGATFSFNGTTGERTAAKGFLEAPVIINGELQTGLGGGICQVSTTVFNAAYEAGLPITARTNHALYISHYPLGRDATVNYPDIDLKFVNNTSHWLLLRTFVGLSSLTVTLYGTPQHRRVESVTAPLRVISPPPVQKTIDATLKPGETVVDDSGVPAQATSVERKVFASDGKLLSDATWYSSYRAEPRIVRVGPKSTTPAKKPKAKKQATTTTTTTTATTTPTAPGGPH
jgi:vancomycin resistance protein YoaR